MIAAYAGIDVAMRRGKPLPVVIAVEPDGVLEPLRLKNAAAKPPRGTGNVAALDPAICEAFADETAAYLQALEQELGIRVERIAIDAPSDAHARELRLCEDAIGRKGLSYFKTPNRTKFEEICAAARAHLAAGKPKSRIPASNQIWMLAGFALFRRLRRDWNCLEVFPQAIAWALSASAVHKRQREGQLAQLAAVSQHTGWPSPPSPDALDGIAYGARHDRLDAYLAAWIASLPEERREAAGVPPNDAIWLPRV